MAFDRHLRSLTTAIDLLAGNWWILYTSDRSLLGIDLQAVELD